jgi:hypothetical protein
VTLLKSLGAKRAEARASILDAAARAPHAHELSLDGVVRAHGGPAEATRVAGRSIAVSTKADDVQRATVGSRHGLTRNTGLSRCIPCSPNAFGRITGESGRGQLGASAARAARCPGLARRARARLAADPAGPCSLLGRAW